ncbi:DNA polymerase III subunit delta [Tissierella sp. Yu-01]|uniref:DNA polymerase III subunit delta n=1 Tax=Tissierella sp. Yu-01 TaxID=3035694 RepID=UPI00240E4E8A|nr:DNA polymerase III subunit delta [Tissierella sp. Yu-01]WFA09528.1 DNA polymerase III subunit delta [Tissierella sp. Yu-01]
MTNKEFMSLMKKGDIDSTYLFIGVEDYLKDECIDLIKGKYIDSSLETLNFVVLDGKISTTDDLINSCETLPFMSPKKIVVLKDISQFFDKEENNSKEMYDYLGNLGDHLCLILLDENNELKKTSKVYKYYKKINKVVEFDKLKGKDLSQWVEKIVKGNNLRISNSNINYLIQNSPYFSKNITTTLYDLENELRKIISYAKDDEITKEDIDIVMVKTIDNNIFDLLSSINKGDVDNALSIFNEIYFSNEPIPKILFMISRQIRLMLSYNIYRERGYTEGESMEKMQIKSYEYSKISAQAKMYSTNELEKYLNLLLSVDKKFKSSASDQRIDMEVLIIRLSKKII